MKRSAIQRAPAVTESRRQERWKSETGLNENQASSWGEMGWIPQFLSFPFLGFHGTLHAPGRARGR